MAIQVDLKTSGFGVGFKNAYYRVVLIELSRQREAKFGVMIDVVGYANKPINDEIKDVDFRRYHASIEDIESQKGLTFFEKTYNWVATQPDMVGSVAV